MTTEQSWKIIVRNGKTHVLSLNFVSNRVHLCPCTKKIKIKAESLSKNLKNLPPFAGTKNRTVLIKNTNSHYTECSMKNVALYFCPYLCQLLTDFRNSFTGTLREQFAIICLLYITSRHVFVNHSVDVIKLKKHWKILL